MRKLALTSCVLALTAGVSASRADSQTPRKVQVGLGGGATLPMGDYADDVKSGFHGLAYLQYEPERNIWGVRGEALYTRGDFTEEARGDAGVGPDAKVYSSTLYLGASAVLLGRKRDRGLTPYLLGGLGYYRTTATIDGTVSQSVTESGVGYSGGAGVRFGKEMGFFVESRFHAFSVSPEGGAKSTYQMIPLSVGVRF